MVGFTSSCTCTVSSRHLFSIEIFYSVKNFCYLQRITKTRLFKYIKKILPPKKWKFLDKNSDIFLISAQKHRLWVLVRTASPFFLFLLKIIDCGYSFEPPQRGGSNEYPQSMFLSRNKKNNVYPCLGQHYIDRVTRKSGRNHIILHAHSLFRAFVLHWNIL